MLLVPELVFSFFVLVLDYCMKQFFCLLVWNENSHEFKNS